MPSFIELERLRQGNCEFKGSLCYRARPLLKTNMSKEVNKYKLKAKPGKISHIPKIHFYKLNLYFFMGLYNVPSSDGH